MQSAKRMVLIDEGWLQHIFSKENLKWKKPVDINVKSTLDQQMKSDLDDSMISDDIKVKQYNRDLTRFLNTRKSLPDEPIAQETTSQLTTSPELAIVKEPVKKKKKKKQPSFPTWRREREIKIPKRFNWDMW